MSFFFFCLFRDINGLSVNCQFGATRCLNVAESNNGFMRSASSCCYSPSFTCCQPSSPLNKEKILSYTNNNLDLHRDASVHREFLKKKQFAIQSKFTCFLIALTACLDAWCILWCGRWSPGLLFNVISKCAALKISNGQLKPESFFCFFFSHYEH